MLVLLCERVEPPRGELEHIHYFCGNTEITEDLDEREPLRARFTSPSSPLFGHLAGLQMLEAAEYGVADIARIKGQLDYHVNVCEVVRRASGESLDLKSYEADMRYLLDTYIGAWERGKISPFDGIGPTGVVAAQYSGCRFSSSI